MVVKTREKIITTRLEYKNSEGMNLVACWDHSQDGYERKPYIIIPPAYGETKKNSLHLGYYLAQNGFNVIRYDATNHIGESDGEIFNATLSQGKDDLIDTMDFLHKEFNVPQFGLVATSVGARVALKCASQDCRINFIINIACVSDFRYTLMTIYNEDLIGDILRNSTKDRYEILGHEISSDFLKLAVRDAYHNLDTTIKDIEKIDIPIVFICPEEDEWNRIEDIDKIIRRFPQKIIQKTIILKGMHTIYENINAAKAAICETVKACVNFSYNIPIQSEQILEPDMKDVIEQNKIEKAWLKKYELTKEEEKQFWNKYMNQYGALIKSNDYLQFLKLITESLGDIHEGDIVLDTGCGNGHLGLYLIHSALQKYQSQNIELLPPSFIYIGVDFVEGPIKEALIKHFGANLKKIELNESQKFFYILQDLDSSNAEPSSGPLFMFSDNTFDKICCSLLLSYVKDPLKVLKELFRVLKPNGKIVVTSMKPYCDLSKIYRNYLQQTVDAADIEEARRLLSAAGKIKEKENIGYYQFFSEEELEDMLTKAGFSNIEIYRSFGNQANVTVVEKGLNI